MNKIKSPKLLSLYAKVKKLVFLKYIPKE